MNEDRIVPEEYQILPEHQVPSEYSPMYPDISFFQESAVTAGEKNIFRGEVPPGERPWEDEEEEKKKKRSRISWLRLLFQSAVRGGAAVLILLIAGVFFLLREEPNEHTSAAAAALREAERPAFVPQEAYPFGDYVMLWNRDPSGPHQYDQDHPRIVKAATCTEKGEQEYVCLKCGVIRTDEVALAAHQPAETVVENETEAVCTEGGSYEEVVYCSVCGTELSRVPVTTPAVGHTEQDPVTENLIEATCTEDGGFDTVVYCVICGEELSRESMTIPAAGHTEADPVQENEIEATCTEDGSYDVAVYCSVCGEELSREAVEVPATGHTEGESRVENRVAATCTEAGHYDNVVRCTVCDEILSSQTVRIPATGHAFTVNASANGTVIRCANCQTPALTLAYSNNTFTYTVNQAFLTALANAGYQPRDVEFEDAMEEELENMGYMGPTGSMDLYVEGAVRPYRAVLFCYSNDGIEYRVYSPWIR